MKILWIWGWTIQWKMYPLCLESYGGAAAKLASGPVKTKISASAVSVLQAALKKKEMHEILTPTLINARLRGPCYSSWLCSAQPQFRKASEHTSLVLPWLKWSANPSDTLMVGAHQGEAHGPRLPSRVCRKRLITEAGT